MMSHMEFTFVERRRIVGAASKQYDIALACIASMLLMPRIGVGACGISWLLSCIYKSPSVKSSAMRYSR